MKKPSIVIPLALLILLQAISLFRIGSLQSQITDLNNQISGVQTSQSSLANSIYTNVENLMKKQASIIDTYDFTFGDVDKTNYAVPVTFIVTPKVSSADTMAKLVLPNETVTMERTGTTYKATSTVSIFEALSATVILSDNGVDKTEKLGEFGLLMEKFIPSYFVTFDGYSGYNKKNGEAAGTYERKGNITLDLHNSGDALFKKASLITEIDGVAVSEHPLADRQVFKVDEKFDLSAGQTIVMYVRAIDSLGLVHKRITNEFSIDSEGNPYDEENWNWNNKETILDENGKILHTSTDGH
ncbi:hypothetical protein [Youngiibacter multivorans]|uniref:Uncharacterized protein n=1 Tax=Youngiibacter multivorans TaxID=937251 RepID=A0ABS4G6L1_9CLOT|nr:hypothetical protein [Youngiibacter multivorans]MBP1920205.1 hypothetical protein [Youngiibacter multivorans]